MTKALPRSTFERARDFLGVSINARPAIFLVIWRRFLKIRQTNRYNKPKLLSMKNRIRSIYFVAQQGLRKRCGLYTVI